MPYAYNHQGDKPKTGRFALPVEMRERQDQFAGREVGLNHPDNDSFIRIRNNGDLEISAGNGVSMVLSATKRSITLIADEIRFMTSEGKFVWNGKHFNESAISFHEPTLISLEDYDLNTPFKNAESYIPLSEKEA